MQFIKQGILNHMMSKLYTVNQVFAAQFLSANASGAFLKNKVIL